LKKIEAVMPHDRLSRAASIISEFPIGGMTYYESKGRGQIPTPLLHVGRGTSVYRPEFNVNVMITLVVPDNLVNDIVTKILDTTSSGLAGEGKIFVSEVNETVDIGTGKRGDTAL